MRHHNNQLYQTGLHTLLLEFLLFQNEKVTQSIKAGITARIIYSLIFISKKEENKIIAMDFTIFVLLKKTW